MDEEWSAVKMKETTLYEYGDGIYAKPLDERVRERVKIFSTTYKVLNVQYEWFPKRYLGKNCCGMEVWKPRECFIHISYMEN